MTIHNGQLLLIECNTYPVIFAAFIQGFTTIVAVLFMNFYIQTYTKKPSSKKKHIPSKDFRNKNGYIAKTNGEHVANGYVINGRVSGDTVVRRK